MPEHDDLASPGTRAARAPSPIPRISRDRRRARTLLGRGAMSVRLPSFACFASLAIAFAQLACGGRVDGVPSAGGATSPPESSTDPTPGGSFSSGGTTGNGPGSARPSDPAESCELACDEGHTIAGANGCASGDACYTRTACGQSITCTGAAGLCEDPQCLGHTIEVKTCAPSATCEAQRVCDRTLLCKKTDAQCDGLAACDEEDEEVASATECAKSGSRCYSRASCGHRTYCVRAF